MLFRKRIKAAGSREGYNYLIREQRLDKKVSKAVFKNKIKPLNHAFGILKGIQTIQSTFESI